MKIRNIALAVGICIVLTGCAGKESERETSLDADIESVAETKQTESEIAHTTIVSAAATTIATTAISTTTEAVKSYSWVKEPFLEADDINAVAAENTVLQYGDFLETDYALMMRGDRIGMVDYDGNVMIEPEYHAVRGMCSSERAHCTFLSVPSQTGFSQLFCMMTGEYAADVDAKCSECGEVLVKETLGLGYVYEYAQSFSGLYAADVLHSAVVGDPLWLYGQFGFERKDGLMDTVVARSVAVLKDYLTNTSEKGAVTGGFGLVRNNAVILPFVYEDALDYKSGVAALCENGKWGYVNAAGDVILPFAYDADFLYAYDPNRYIPNFGTDGKDVFVPFLPSEGYIALNQGEQAGYCDTDGSEIIPVGEFLNARPVHDGKAWVQDAATKLWGVISLN